MNSQAMKKDFENIYLFLFYLLLFYSVRQQAGWKRKRHITLGC
jgi:hypothetical protein